MIHLDYIDAFIITLHLRYESKWKCNSKKKIHLNLSESLKKSLKLCNYRL